MNDFVIGRKKQIRELQEALHGEKPEFLALIGRRRVGKTYLVRKVYGDNIDFELTGLQHANKSEQLLNFYFSLEKFFPDYSIKGKPRSWLDAFNELGKALDSVNKSGKKIIFLDELPWLGTKRSGFITGLSYFWNSWASQRQVVLVVCGSAASWMIKKIINDRGGLHNRVTRLMYLYPFTLSETEAYCKKRKIRLNRYQLLQIYMTMGGIPMYLDQLKPGFSAIQNIQEVFFAKGGYLRNEFERLFASLFDAYQSHVEIIRALASKRRGMSRQEIIASTSLTNGGMLTGILDELEQSGFITAYGGYGKKVKESLFRLTDFYSLFYLSYIEPLGKSSNVDFTNLSDLPKWKSWSGYTFENVCLYHVDAIRKTLSIAGIASSTASFVARPKDGLPGAQIDLLIDRSDQCINLCEIKFSTGVFRLNKQDAEALDRKKQVFQYHTQTPKHLFTTMISPFGLLDNTYRISYVDQVVNMDNLFES